MDRFGILSERVVLLDAFTVEQNLALPLSLEVDDMSVSRPLERPALADEVGITREQLPQSAARLDAEMRNCACGSARRWPSGRACSSLNTPTPRCRRTRCRDLRPTSQASPRARRLAMLVMTADSTFARAVSDRVLTLKPATGELARTPGWRNWFCDQAVAYAARGTELGFVTSGSSGDGPRRLLDVANGTIKRLVRDRGFGFIRDEGGQEWFFHRTSVTAGSFEELNEGQRVSFDEEPSAKGPRAGNIRSEGNSTAA